MIWTCLAQTSPRDPLLVILSAFERIIRGLSSSHNRRLHLMRG